MIWLWVLGGIVMVFAVTALTGAPYVPTRSRDAGKVFDELHPLTSSDVVVDIGSGDGVVLRAAARRGARAVGYEINPILAGISKAVTRGNKGITIKWANYWRAQLPDDTTVVYTFGESRDIERMAGKVRCEATRIGRRLTFISYAFEVPGETLVVRNDMNFVYYIDPLQDAKA